jgi:glycerol-3-phosphate acyltransferase PlsX
LRVAIDLMGSEHAPQVLFKALLEAVRRLAPDDVLIAIALPEIIEQLSSTYLSSISDIDSAKIQFISASSVVSPDENPLLATRRKKDSTMAKGISLLKEGKVDAFVTTGNTGALIAQATISLPTLPGITRPALLATIPSKDSPVCVLDVGANILCKWENLIQFAQMGIAYQQCCCNVDIPRVGFLNIGSEAMKGTESIRRAYQELEESDPDFKKSFTFCGNIESHDVFCGKVDVLVTDGFTGNIFIKTSEGISAFIFDKLLNGLGPNPPKRLTSTLENLAIDLDYAQYPGAILCGIEGVVVKCHGYSNQDALLSGIMGACHAVRQGLVKKIKHTLHDFQNP